MGGWNGGPTAPGTSRPCASCVLYLCECVAMRLVCRREMGLAIGCLICGCYSLVLDTVHGHRVGRVSGWRTSTWSTTTIRGRRRVPFGENWSSLVVE